MFTKAKEVKTYALSKIAEEAQTAVENIKYSFEVAKMVLNHVEMDIGSLDEDYYDVYFSRWGKGVDFSDIKRRDIYDSFLIALTELFGNGKRSRSWDNMIKYTFEDVNGCTIELKVSTELTGCTIVNEKVLVEEKVTPAHYEEKIKIKCDKE